MSVSPTLGFNIKTFVHEGQLCSLKHLLTSENEYFQSYHLVIPSIFVRLTLYYKKRINYLYFSLVTIKGTSVDRKHCVLTGETTLNRQMQQSGQLTPVIDYDCQTARQNSINFSQKTLVLFLLFMSFATNTLLLIASHRCFPFSICK